MKVNCTFLLAFSVLPSALIAQLDKALHRKAGMYGFSGSRQKFLPFIPLLACPFTPVKLNK